MYCFYSHSVQQSRVVRGNKTNIQSLREVYTSAAFRKLPQHPLVLRARQKIGVQQFDLALTVPKFGQLRYLTALPSLLSGNDAKRTLTRTSPCKKAVCSTGKLRIKGVVRALMFYLIGKVRPWAVASTAPNNLVGVCDIDAVLGIGVGKHSAFVDKIITALRLSLIHI